MALLLGKENINKIYNELKLKYKNIKTINDKFSFILKIKDELTDFYKSNKYLYEIFPELKKVIFNRIAIGVNLENIETLTGKKIVNEEFNEYIQIFVKFSLLIYCLNDIINYYDKDFKKYHKEYEILLEQNLQIHFSAKILELYSEKISKEVNIESIFEQEKVKLIKIFEKVKIYNIIPFIKESN